MMTAPAPAIGILSAYRQLNEPERKFVDSYVVRLDHAANNAGERISNALYRPIPDDVRIASRGMLDRPMVLAAITERVNEIAAASEISVERIIRELSAIAFSNLDDYMTVNEWGVPVYDFSKCTPEQMAAIQSWEHVEDIKKGRHIKLKTHSKLEALKMLKDLYDITPEHPWVRQHNTRPEIPQIRDGATTSEAADVYQKFLGTAA